MRLSKNTDQKSVYLNGLGRTNYMKTNYKTFTLAALGALALVGCGKKNKNNNNYYNTNYAGACRTGSMGAVAYAERGIGYAVRNGVPAELDLTFFVDEQGRMGASGQLRISDARRFFSEGYGNSGNPYLDAPISGAVDVCVTTQGLEGSWNNQYNQTASGLVLRAGSIEIEIAPGAFIESNGFFASNARVMLRGHSTGYDSVTFDPNPMGF